MLRAQVPLEGQKGLEVVERPLELRADPVLLVHLLLVSVEGAREEVEAGLDQRPSLLLVEQRDVGVDAGVEAFLPRVGDHVGEPRVHEGLTAMEEVHVVRVVRDLVDDRGEEPEVHETVVFLDHVLVRAVAALQVAAARRLDPEPDRELGDLRRPAPVGPEDAGEAPHVAEVPSVHPTEYSRRGRTAPRRGRSGRGANDLHPAQLERGLAGRDEAAPPAMQAPTRRGVPHPGDQPVAPRHRVGGHEDPPANAHLLGPRPEVGQEPGQRIVVPEPGVQWRSGRLPGGGPRPSGVGWRPRASASGS